MTPVAISILNFNGDTETDALLESIDSLFLGNIALTVYVLDNGSKAAYVQKKQYQHFVLVLLREQRNLGFSGGHNKVIHRAMQDGSDYIMVLNNDTILAEDLLRVLLKTAKDTERVGMVVPKIYFGAGSEYHKERYKREELGKVIWYAGGLIDWKNVLASHRGVDEVDRGQYDKTVETDFATGCCMLLSSGVIKRLGLFDERYFLYFEDSDLSERVKRSGLRIVYEPRAVLWHANAASTGGSGSSLQDYYISRNRMLFGFSYAPLRSKIALFRESLGLLQHGRPMQKRGIMDFYLRRFGKGKIDHV